MNKHSQLFFLFNFVKLSIIVMIEKLTYLMLYFLTLPKIVLITPTHLDLGKTVIARFTRIFDVKTL